MKSRGKGMHKSIDGVVWHMQRLQNRVPRCEEFFDDVRGCPASI
jgi:hypothetical protein